jgi:hypothetical protein
LKKLILFLCLLFLSFFSHAENRFYIQGQINTVMPGDVDSKTYSGTVDGVAISNLKASFDFENSTTGGIEIGFKNIYDTNFRAGLQYIAPEFEFNKLDVSATATINGTNYNVGTTYSRSDATTDGLNLDIDAKMLFLNLYYDFAGYWDTFVPFLGIGAGIADYKGVDAREPAVAGMVGFKKYIDDDKQFYFGHKSTYTRSSGPELDGGLKFEDVEFYTATFQFGYEF